MELIEQAIEHATRAAGLRAESARLADAAEFHAAVSRAYLRDIAEQQASEGGDPPAAPVHRRAADRDIGEGGGA